MTPAMIVSWLAGLVLITFQGGAIGWLHIKLLLVLGMTAVHGAMASWVRAFAQDRNLKSHRFFRIANEVPTLLMIVIVILVIVKPF
jgi:putative membrane protein